MKYLALSLLFCGLTLAACAPAAAPLPTRTPAPTFTPTVPAPAGDTETNNAQNNQTTLPVAEVTPPAQPQQSQLPAEAPAANSPAENPPAPTSAPPTDTPPALPEVVANSTVNVRNGPGTTYLIIGSANAGQRFAVTAKSPAGDWWQINYNGSPGWVFAQLVTASNTQAVAVAQNIPAPPPPTNPPAPPPTSTPVPVAQAPAPTAPPAKKYLFNIAVVGRCDPQEAGNWFEGKTYVNGQAKSGYNVVFSYAADGPPITAPVVSGPHTGYEGWNEGYYSHIINSPETGPKAGTWYVWVMDNAGARISEIASFTTKGPGGSCNQAVVDFDSR
jgi:hypothetical protein